MNLERTILNRAPDFGRKPPSRQFVTSTARPRQGWNWHRGHRQPGVDARDIINLRETARANEEWQRNRKAQVHEEWRREREERERKEAEKKEAERKEEERKRKEDQDKKRKEEEESQRRGKKAKTQLWENMKKKMADDMEWIKS